MRVIFGWLALFLCVGTAFGQAGITERVAAAPLSSQERDAVISLLGAKGYPQIGDVLTKAADRAPEHAAELSALLGAIDFLGGRMQEAAAALRVSDSRKPLGERDRFTLAMALTRLGDAAGARAELTALNTARPEQPLYLYWLARLDYDGRLYRDSVEKLERVVKLDPKSPRGYDNLGLSLDMLGQYDEALEAFRKAAECNRALPQPSAWPPHNLGYLLLRLERTEESETALRESLRYDPRFALAHYRLGRVLEKEGKDSEAVEEYRAAIALDRALAEPCYSLGLLYRRLKRFAEAKQALAEYNVRKHGSGSQ